MKIAVTSGGQSVMIGTDPYLEAEIKSYYGPEAILIRGALPGGPTILELQKGKPIYEAWVASCLDAIADGFTIIYGVFVQGQSDTYNPDIYLNWDTYYNALLNSFRTDIGIQNLRFITGILGKVPTHPDSPAHPGWTAVQRHQLNTLYGRPKFDRVDLGPFGPYLPSNPWCHYDEGPNGYPGIAKEIISIMKIRYPKPV